MSTLEVLIAIARFVGRRRGSGGDPDTLPSSWGHDLHHSLRRLSDTRAGAVPDVPLRPRRSSGRAGAPRHRRRRCLQRPGPRRHARAQVPQLPARGRSTSPASWRNVSPPPAATTSTSSRGRPPARRAAGGAASTRPRCSPERWRPTSGCRAGASSSATERRPAQTGRGRRERLSGPRFRVHPRAAGRRVLVVDDVVTTGATLDAARRWLRHGGAADVVLAAVAATPDCLLPTQRAA